VVKEIPVLIPCAGKGRRLAPVTDWVPKALLPLPSGKPVLIEILERLSDFHPENIYVSIPVAPHAHKLQFLRALSGKNVGKMECGGWNNVGDALELRHRFCDGSPGFLLHYCDELTEMPYHKVIEDALRVGAEASLVVCETMPCPYGVVESVSGELKKLEEKKQVRVQNWAGVGFFKWSALDGARPEEDFAKDLIPRLLREGKVVRGFRVPGPRVEMSDLAPGR